MIARNFKPEDTADVIRINAQQDFRIKDRYSCIVDATVENNGNIVAYGIVKNLAEAIVLVDLEKPKLTRMKAIRELMKVAMFGAARKGIPQLHCFVSDRALADLLIKHYGFVESKDIVLVKNI